MTTDRIRAQAQEQAQALEQMKAPVTVNNGVIASPDQEFDRIRRNAVKSLCRSEWRSALHLTSRVFTAARVVITGVLW